jgi:hypothetical protein
MTWSGEEVGYLEETVISEPMGSYALETKTTELVGCLLVYLVFPVWHPRYIFWLMALIRHPFSLMSIIPCSTNYEKVSQSQIALRSI